MSDQRFYFLKARLKKGETLTVLEKRQFLSLGRDLIREWRCFPLTPDVKANIKTIQSDMGLTRRVRIKSRAKAAQNPMRDVLS